VTKDILNPDIKVKITDEGMSSFFSKLQLNYSLNLKKANDEKETVIIQNIILNNTKIRVTFYAEDIEQ